MAANPGQPDRSFVVFIHQVVTSILPYFLVLSSIFQRQLELLPATAVMASAFMCKLLHKGCEHVIEECVCALFWSRLAGGGTYAPSTMPTVD